MQISRKHHRGVPRRGGRRRSGAANQGLMTPSANDFRRYRGLTEANIIHMIKNASSPTLYTDENSQSTGKGHVSIINKTIERLYDFNYSRVKK